MADKTEELNALEQIMVEGKLARDEGQKAYAQDLIGEFIDSVVESGTDVSSDTVASINQKIAEIDALITEQLNEVMHQPDFQKLEASWRGLHFLVMGTETGTQLKLRVLNTSSKDLLADLEKAVEFDQSALFKMIYEEEYGTFGGHPYSCLMADFEFGRHPQQFALMEKLAEVAAAAHAPMIASASPRMFDMDSFTDLGTPRDLSKIFESAEMIKWRSFRDSEDSRYMVLTLPHTLMRLPYGPNTVPVEGIDFAEDVDGRDHSKYLWGSAAWAMAQRITNAFSLYGWTAAIRGVEGGGVVKGLPTHTFKTDEGDIALKCPTEIAITDRREKELSDLGFIALCHCKGTDYAAFFGGQTVQKPKKYNLDSANANAALSARLPYIMAASRFAHYMKAIMRDKVGSFLTAANVEEYLNTWIANYVLLTDDAPQNTKARFPLREARVDVREIPGKPGAYNATVFLKPHFQLEELTASVRLVAELPPPAA
ncbi:MAG: type VI secretion system contractile sheath large subunit [Rhodospirillaceae bacterium]|jgi:type VI secretion system protein ImpC|uniref:type VI secretion system contractile sheath large subunit n=1 Tax=Hwanghaeella sp. 1Z406 TaxID=3402811 RepID=UPI000C3E00EA|nr:type VI secretion system contractile sheath large subunit [Rhodospirillales bacterium]MAX47778.1 type VI secretion system contractile sheath large subunit [Rhodospirillaceae bacterium]|tara:strand:+ start:24845 stop:26296 length:1452 start_codon:yes stop_codon:yes gene_type:complete